MEVSSLKIVSHFYSKWNSSITKILPFKFPSLLFLTLNGVEHRGKSQPLSPISSRLVTDTIVELFLPFMRLIIFQSHLDSQSHFNGLPSINRMFIFIAVLSNSLRLWSRQCSMLSSVNSGKFENDDSGSSEKCIMN